MDALNLLSQFVVLYQQKRYRAALEMCDPSKVYSVLRLEPGNRTILEFRRVLAQKLIAGEINESESSEESEESEDSEPEVSGEDISGEDISGEDSEEDELSDDASFDGNSTIASTAASVRQL
jgi:hypothetical protein